MFMKKNFLLLLIAHSSWLAASSQNIGIGTNNPQNKLHVAGGFRLDTLTGVGGAGLMRHDANGVVYGIKFTGNITDVLRGDGTFGSSGVSSVGWALNGNSGTNPANNFIGTTDDQPINFRVNNETAGALGLSNTAFGYHTLYSNTTGNHNIAIGVAALKANTVGHDLLAIGDSALFNQSVNTTDGIGYYHNVAVGTNSLFANTSGYYNVANIAS